MLSGRPDDEGGSTRRKGEDEKRRLLRRPTRLCFGDPRLWAMGVLFAVFGTESERVLGLGFVAPVLALLKPSNGEMTGVAVFLGASTRVNLNAFVGVPSTALPFFEGEKRMFGSMFSVSRSSSNGSIDRRRFMGEVSWPLEGEAMFA